MAKIMKNLGQAGSGLNSERGDGNDVRGIFLSILADLEALNTAIEDLDTAGTHGISLPVLTTSKEV